MDCRAPKTWLIHHASITGCFVNCSWHSGGCCGCCFFLLVRYGPCEAEALKGRMLRAVASLGAAEVKSILEEQGQVEVRQ